MPLQYEVVFVQHLVVADSLAQIVQMELPEDLLPSEALRVVHHFAVDYWHTEANGKVPSPEAMRVHFDNLLAENQIDLDIDPEDTLTWALECLRGNYIDRHWQVWVRKFSTEMAGGDVLSKSITLNSGIEEMMQIQTALSSRNEHIEVRRSVGLALEMYERRAELRISGMSSGAVFGFREIDEHIGGIRDGELAVLGGIPKVGKTYGALASAKACHDNGGVPVVVMLEISPQSGLDRVACMAMGVDSIRWERGLCTPEEIARVREWQTIMENHQRPFHIIQPGIGQRTVEHLVRRGKALGDVLIIDQLTFVEPSPNSVRLPRYQQIGNSLHDLKAGISTGKSLPCILVHQISRDGQKDAERYGRLKMWHFAEAAEVERTADIGVGMFQTPSMRDADLLYWQMLASRRTDLQSWQLVWRPWMGFMMVQHPVRLGD